MELFSKTSQRLKRIGSRNPGFTGAIDRSAGSQPGTRDMRAQAVHRLQVGLFGLAAMLLLVSLASVILQRVQTVDRGTVATQPTGNASTAQASDPLVDLGVAPEVPVAGAARAPARPARPAPKP